jgi:hypothetical protein
MALDMNELFTTTCTDCDQANKCPLITSYVMSTGTSMATAIPERGTIPVQTPIPYKVSDNENTLLSKNIAADATTHAAYHYAYIVQNIVFDLNSAGVAGYSHSFTDMYIPPNPLVLTSKPYLEGNVTIAFTNLQFKSIDDAFYLRPYKAYLKGFNNIQVTTVSDAASSLLSSSSIENEINYLEFTKADGWTTGNTYTNTEAADSVIDIAKDISDPLMTVDISGIL